MTRQSTWAFHARKFTSVSYRIRRRPWDYRPARLTPTVTLGSLTPLLLWIDNGAQPASVVCAQHCLELAQPFSCIVFVIWGASLSSACSTQLVHGLDTSGNLRALT